MYICMYVYMCVRDVRRDAAICEEGGTRNILEKRREGREGVRKRMVKGLESGEYVQLIKC